MDVASPFAGLAPPTPGSITPPSSIKGTRSEFQFLPCVCSQCRGGARMPAALWWFIVLGTFACPASAVLHGAHPEIRDESPMQASLDGNEVRKSCACIPACWAWFTLWNHECLHSMLLVLDAAFCKGTRCTHPPCVIWTYKISVYCS